MSTATLTRIENDYKVADMALADWGRKEIDIRPSTRCPA